MLLERPSVGRRLVRNLPGAFITHHQFIIADRSHRPERLTDIADKRTRVDAADRCQQVCVALVLDHASGGMLGEISE